MWLKIIANLLFCSLVIAFLTSCFSRTEISNTNVDLTEIMKNYDSENQIDTEKELKKLNEQNEIALKEVLEILEQGEIDLSKLETLMSIIHPLKEIERNLVEFTTLTKNLEAFIVELEQEELKINTDNINPDQQEKKEQINKDRHLVMQQFLKLRADQTKASETAFGLKKFVSEIMVNNLASSEPFQYESFISGTNSTSSNADFNYDLSNFSYSEISELAKGFNKNDKINKYVIYAETISDDASKNIMQLERILDVVEIFNANEITTSKLSLVTFMRDIDDLERSDSDKLKIFLKAE